MQPKTNLYDIWNNYSGRISNHWHTRRTTNENEQSRKDIGELWQKFSGTNIIEQIPNKESNDIYCIYTDYESDFTGPYTTILGCKVTSIENVPEGLISKTIPKAKFQRYTSTGKIPDCVLATWRHIWESPINRRYLADFDVYGENSQDLNNAVVDTYLSVK